MKLYKSAIALLMLLFALAVPGMASASTETADADVSITPRSGSTFFNDAFSAADWKVETAISVPPATPKIQPMKIADLGFPPSSAMTFNPKASMPVCSGPDLGPPPVNLNIRPDVMLDRCPAALIGNGTALFGLGQSTFPAATRNGEILIFNGGLDGGLPKINIYAYSLETGAGIYTTATLQPDGQLRFDIPVLTSDSSVRTLNLDIPGKRLSRPYPDFNTTVILPAGLDPDYVQAKCAGNGGFPWTADFTMGSRTPAGLPAPGPTGIEFNISDSGTAPCTGVAAAAKIGSVRVIGPGTAKRGRPTVYKVAVKNTGTRTATGVKLVLSGRGVRVKASVGSIAAGQTKTVKTTVRFRSKGRIKMTAKASSSNGGSRSGTKVVRVR